MLKVILAVVVVSIFAITGLALAKNSPSTDYSTTEMWNAINDLRNEVAELRLERTKQEPLKKPTAIDGSKKTSKETVAGDSEDSNVFRSEHFTMRGAVIQ